MNTAQFKDATTRAVIERNELWGVEIQDESVRRRIKRDGIVGLAETYIDGGWTSDRLDELMYRVFTSPPPPISYFAWAKLLMAAGKKKILNQQAGQRAFNIGVQHYDLGNELFRCMLDESMTYTSGYWRNTTNLHDAQQAKLDVICRKLNLQPGEHVLDIGCGWGNFAHYAATHYSARVTGITVSKEQMKMAKQRCEGLPVDIRLQDYRDVHEKYDHVVSIEMIEAVGPKNIPIFYHVVDRCLKDKGLFILQAISGHTLSRLSDRRLDQFILWLVKYIFPDGCLPQKSDLAGPANSSLHIEDWQRFHDDYDRTLLAWAKRFNANWGVLEGQYDQRFRRCWNFYLSGCAAAFRAGLVDVYQIVYSKGDRPKRYQPER